jgi:hypothetical protein
MHHVPTTTHLASHTNCLKRLFGRKSQGVHYDHLAVGEVRHQLPSSSSNPDGCRVETRRLLEQSCHAGEDSIPGSRKPNPSGFLRHTGRQGSVGPRSDLDVGPRSGLSGLAPPHWVRSAPKHLMLPPIDRSLCHLCTFPVITIIRTTVGSMESGWYEL